MELGVELELDNNTVRDKGIYIYIFYKTPNKIVVFCTFESIKIKSLFILDPPGALEVKNKIPLI